MNKYLDSINEKVFPETDGPVQACSWFILGQNNQETCRLCHREHIASCMVAYLAKIYKITLFMGIKNYHTRSLVLRVHQ